MAISALVGSPRAKGLFHRAISESGNWMGLRMGAMAPYAPAEAAGLKKAEAAGATSLKDLRAMSAEDVTAKLGGRGPAGMIADGYIFPKDLNKVFADGKQNAVDVLVGSNAHESFFPGGPKAKQFKAQIQHRWGDLTPAVLKVYPAATDAEAAASSSAMFSDEVTWLMRLYASDQLKLGKKAYVFSFAYNPPSPQDKQAHPTHAAEIPYVFDNIGKPRLFPDMSSPELAAKSPVAQKLGDEMSSYWVNFARTGNPNGKGLPKWPAYTGMETGKAMILDAKTMAEKKPDTAMLDLYTRLFNKESSGNASGK
jgi:para-nitrobenzyl esterase